jgi:hypothetical protein
MPPLKFPVARSTLRLSIAHQTVRLVFNKVANRVGIIFDGEDPILID